MVTAVNENAFSRVEEPAEVIGTQLRGTASPASPENSRVAVDLCPCRPSRPICSTLESMCNLASVTRIFPAVSPSAFYNNDFVQRINSLGLLIALIVLASNHNWRRINIKSFTVAKDLCYWIVKVLLSPIQIGLRAGSRWHRRRSFAAVIETIINVDARPNTPTKSFAEDIAFRAASEAHGMGVNSPQTKAGVRMEVDGFDMNRPVTARGFVNDHDWNSPRPRGMGNRSPELADDESSDKDSWPGRAPDNGRASVNDRSRGRRRRSTSNYSPGQADNRRSESPPLGLGWRQVVRERGWDTAVDHHLGPADHPSRTWGPPMPMPMDHSAGWGGPPMMPPGWAPAMNNNLMPMADQSSGPAPNDGRRQPTPRYRSRSSTSTWATGGASDYINPPFYSGWSPAFSPYGPVSHPPQQPSNWPPMQKNMSLQMSMMTTHNQHKLDQEHLRMAWIKHKNKMESHA